MKLSPVPVSEATDKVEQTYGRLKEMFGSDDLPEAFLIYANVPAFLQDFYMNFKKFCYTAGKLDEKQKAIVGLAAAAQLKSQPWIDYFSKRLADLGADEQTSRDVVAVTATCAMYNVFYKFRDISGSDIFSGMPVGLRAHTFTGTTLDTATVELINVVISDMNGCRPCTTGHLGAARKAGLSDEALLEGIQCAAVITSGATFLNAADGKSGG